MIPEPVFGPADAKWTRQQILEDDKGTLEQRIARVQRVRVHRIIPHLWFRFASTECGDLFRDGHFYGCICLSQSVAEGLAKFVLGVHDEKIGKQKRRIDECERPAGGRKLIGMLKRLKRGTRNGEPMSVLSENCLKAFDCLEGGDRDDFHHLNRCLITDLEKLERRAEECVMALYDIESELFGFDITTSGRLTPRQPQYWRCEEKEEKYVRVLVRAY